MLHKNLSNGIWTHVSYVILLEEYKDEHEERLELAWHGLPIE